MPSAAEYRQLLALAVLIGFFGGAFIVWMIYGIILRASDHAAAAARLKDMKDQFIALCSHYLLSPITIIQAGISSLKEEGFSITQDQRDRLYDNIFRGQQRLWLLAEQFLLVQQLDGNDVNLSISVSNISSIVTQAIVVVDPFARERKVTIRVNDDEAHEIREARVDPRRLKLAFAAILDNAVKFSPEGGQVNVRVLLEDGIFSVIVADQGAGMSKEVLSHMSEGFYRGNSVYTFDHEGMGLGTYVAISLIRLHGGQILFDSKPQQGSTVTIQFPVE